MAVVNGEEEMNKTDYLISCLGEECGETQQIVGKSLRFGLFEVYHKIGEDNLTRLKKEVHDIIAIYEMLCEEIDYDHTMDLDLIDYKKKRTIRYMQYSRDVGRLDNEQA